MFRRVKIKSKNNIWAFVRTLIKRVGMKAHGDTIIENLLPGTDNEGYSVLQMITTSNITIFVFNVLDIDTTIITT